MKVNTDRIIIERMRRGWKQGDLAEKVHRKQSAISRVERGESKRPDLLKSIAEVLEIPMEELIVA